MKESEYYPRPMDTQKRMIISNLHFRKICTVVNGFKLQIRRLLRKLLLVAQVKIVVATQSWNLGF